MQKIKVLLLAASFLVIGSAKADVFKSPFPSTVPGVNIPNAHFLEEKQPLVLRGMAPLTPKDVRELAKIGITDILVFRNSVPGEEGMLTKEQVLAASPKIKRIFTEPFKWKDVTEFQEPCRQTVRALKIMRDVRADKKRGLYFHCTVGEDRTGYLAGLYRIIFQGQGIEEAFQNEMCAHGYAEGNPTKPEHVSSKVQSNITPLFWKMVDLYQAGLVTSENLDEDVCEFEPLTPPQINFACKVQKL